MPALTLRSALLIFLRGFAMGAADVVPGVSGGTIAFITGIYERLIRAISHADVDLFKMLRRWQWRQAWQHVDGTFVLVLFAGIATSIFTLAHGISYLLEVYPLFIWSFFVGLVLASGVLLVTDISDWGLPTAILLVVGIAAALIIGELRPSTVNATLPYIFLCGAIAICAMLLPGVSGSFLLLVLGVYDVVLGAVKHFDIAVIAVFGVGAVFGLLGFAKLLAYALARARDKIFALLTGFLFGSVGMIWPWQLEQGQNQVVSVLPSRFGAETGGDPQTLLCCLLMAVGISLVLILGRFKGE